MSANLSEGPAFLDGPGEDNNTAPGLAAARVDLDRQVEQAESAVRTALLTGSSTAEARAVLLKTKAAIRQHREKLAAMRGEFGAQQNRVVAERGEEIARGAADRLRLRLAELAPPRPPATLRRAA